MDSNVAVEGTLDAVFSVKKQSKNKEYDSGMKLPLAGRFAVT
jgi:hypothetical protein